MMFCYYIKSSRPWCRIVRMRAEKPSVSVGSKWWSTGAVANHQQVLDSHELLQRGHWPFLLSSLRVCVSATDQRQMFTNESSHHHSHLWSYCEVLEVASLTMILTMAVWTELFTVRKPRWAYLLDMILEAASNCTWLMSFFRSQYIHLFPPGSVLCRHLRLPPAVPEAHYPHFSLQIHFPNIHGSPSSSVT